MRLRRNKKGIFRFIAVLALLVFISYFFYTSTLSVFSDDYVVVGLFPLGVIDAELDFHQKQVALSHVGMQSVPLALSNWDFTSNHAQLSRDSSGLIVLQEYDTTYFPSFDDTLEAFAQRLNPFIEKYRLAYNRRNIGHTQHTSRPGSVAIPLCFEYDEELGWRERTVEGLANTLNRGDYVPSTCNQEHVFTEAVINGALQNPTATIGLRQLLGTDVSHLYSDGRMPGGRSFFAIPTNYYQLGYNNGNLQLVPSLPDGFLITRPPAKGELGTQVKITESGWNGWYTNQAPIEVPLTEEQQLLLYPFQDWLDRTARAELCIRYMLHNGYEPVQFDQDLDFCENVADVLIDINGVENNQVDVAFRDDEFIAYKYVYCSGTKTEQDEQNMQNFDQRRANIAQIQSQIDQIEFTSNLIEYDEDLKLGKNIWFKFEKKQNDRPQWYYRLGREPWEELSYDHPDLTSNTDDRVLALEILRTQQFSFEEGVAALVAALKSSTYNLLIDDDEFNLYDPDTEEFIEEIWDDDIFDVNTYITVVTNVQMIGPQFQYQELQEQLDEETREFDEVLQTPVSCSIDFIQYLTQEDVDIISKPYFLPFLKDHIPSVYNRLDTNQDGEVTTQEAIQTFEQEIASGEYANVDLDYSTLKALYIEQIEATLQELDEEQLQWLSSEENRQLLYETIWQYQSAQSFDINQDEAYSEPESWYALQFFDESLWPEGLKSQENQA